MKLVFLYMVDSEEQELIHGSGVIQDLHGLMASTMDMEIIGVDISVTGIYFGGSTGKATRSY